MWARHRATHRVLLCANVHSIDGTGVRKIKGDAAKRLAFKSRCVQSILDQVVISTRCTECPSPDTGFHSCIMGGDFNLTHNPMSQVLQEAVVDDDVLLSFHGLGSMWGMSSLATTQEFLFPKIVGPDNGHEALLVRAEFAQIAPTVVLTLAPHSASTVQAASKIMDQVRDAT